MTEPQPEIKPVIVNDQPSAFTRNRQSFGNWVASKQPPDKPANQNLLGYKVPGVFANRQTIVFSWAISIAILSWDDWHNNHILPRPSRLWSATWFYLILILVGLVDALVPLANALAVGYTLMLAMQYFQGAGSFSK